MLELNGAADFDADYAGPGRDVYEDVAAALGLLALRAPARAAAG